MGNATSFAPSWIGRMTLPSDAGMLGTMKRNTITTPWNVNSRLYSSAVRKSEPGFISSARTISAAMPATAKKSETVNRYITPIRLWSTVVAHALIVGQMRAAPRTSGPGPGSRR